jgi:hypothetical protein
MSQSHSEKSFGKTAYRLFFRKTLYWSFWKSTSLVKPFEKEVFGTTFA